MRYESISDIYSANEKLLARFHATVSGITEAEASAVPDGEKWSIAEIVEHVSMVEMGISRICSKLVEKAKSAGKAADGLAVSDTFMLAAAGIADKKLEAPDRVQPNGGVAIADSLAKMQETSAQVADIRDDLEMFDLSGSTFPHPYLGDMTAAEWLVMYGGHAARHGAQIERMLTKIRQ